MSVPPAVSRLSSFKARMFKLHRALAWLGFTAMLVWGVSGLLHPWLSTFGVQQAVFAPPQRALNLSQSPPFEQIMRRAGIESALAVKVVVGESANLLQITTAQGMPQRYFNLETGTELPGYDRTHAVFLARHYLGLPDTKVRHVEWINQFSADYPAVNRLLPVYRVHFDREDQMNAYVYTETGVLAGLSDLKKSRVQTAFQWFHTWSWMPNALETPRVLLMGILVGGLLLMALSGLSMLVLIRRKTRAPGAKGWHRIAGYALVVPIAAFSFSGFYHLVQHAWPEAQSRFTMPSPMRLEGLTFPVNTEWQALTESLVISGLSIVMNQAGDLHYRLALPVPQGQLPVQASAIRNARFDGVQPTGPALYINAITGQPWLDGDREMAFQLAEMHTGLPRSSVNKASLIARFGGDYDFRNKRLPVWKFEYDEPLNATVFVDTATGAMVDQTPNWVKPEIWSFSILHKWSFLSPLGRNTQNALISLVVILGIVFMAGFGLRSRYRRASPSVRPPVRT